MQDGKPTASAAEWILFREKLLLRAMNEVSNEQRFADMEHGKDICLLQVTEPVLQQGKRCERNIFSVPFCLTCETGDVYFEIDMVTYCKEDDTVKALITGASSGLGRDMARVLAEKGWDLVLTARRLDRLEMLAAELSGVRVRVIGADLSKPEECLRLYRETAGEEIDLLINNAGFGNFGRFDETDLERDLDVISTNITAVHILTKLFVRDFVKRDGGRILNVASSAGFMAGPMLSGYYASKNYVVRLTEAIHEELRRQKSRVTVSLLCPGPVHTEFNQVAGVRFALRGLSSGYVARYAVERALRGKLIIQPGVLMRLARFGSRFLPEKAMLRISYHIQKSKDGAKS